MLKYKWDNAPTTAAMYIGIIILLYIAGLFLLLIQSIKQRTDQVTFYDIYLELSDIVKFVTSIFCANSKAKVETQLQQLPNDDTKNTLLNEDDSRTPEGNKYNLDKI